MAPEESPPFDAANATHVALYDELPLWSALAGQLLLEHVPLDPRRALDVGCGAGFPALELAERLGPATHVTGLDPWRAGLARAQRKRATWPVPNASFVEGDGANLPFRDSAFDLVVSNLGVNNFADPDAALGECRRVLARGGALALSTNLVGTFRELDEAFEAVLAREADAAALERLRAYVAHRATVDGLARRLQRSGFRVEAVHNHLALLRVRDGRALLSHHFLRLGFLASWREVAGEARQAEVLESLRLELDRRAGTTGLVLSVRLAAIVARAT